MFALGTELPGSLCEHLAVEIGMGGHCALRDCACVLGVRSQPRVRDKV